MLRKIPEYNKDARKKTHGCGIAYNGGYDQQEDIKGLGKRYSPADDHIRRLHEIPRHKNKGKDRETKKAW
jgi:hypothetical protein